MPKLTEYHVVSGDDATCTDTKIFPARLKAEAVEYYWRLRYIGGCGLLEFRTVVIGEPRRPKSERAPA